jgi:hypothetical protein
LPDDFALLGRKRKNIKSKKTEKLKEKRTYIVVVRDILGPFATIPISDPISFSLPTTFNFLNDRGENLNICTLKCGIVV